MEQAMDQSVDSVPLVVDLDGTLIKVDSLHEAFIQLVSKQPLNALRGLLMLMQGARSQGRAAFKANIANYILPDAKTIPINNSVLAAIRQARLEGRKVYLATAADKRVAEEIASSIGEFDGVFASENGINLKGKAKADHLIATFGEQGFDYIGNAAVDIPIWRAARRALISGASPRLIKRLNGELPDLATLDSREFQIQPYFFALRPHQWLKNSLLALPALAGHDFNITTFITIMIAFLSFSLGASGIYLINDMFDLPHDRAHPEKRHRPLAAGTLPLSHAVALFCLLIALSVAMALTLPWMFLLILAGYFSLSMSYSLYLKRKLMIDVVALAALYGIRVVAGGVAIGISLSDWLIGFCFFIFLSLALVKRTTEMMTMSESSVGNIKGRGYRREDLPIINALTAASGFVAVLVLALYINSPDVKSLYRRPDLLWGICMILTYWLGRVYFLTGRGEMRQDPVIFAATDWVSLLTGALVAAIFLLAL
jgi:4-hydroxybenzoate polyprenyltransferase